MTIRFDALPQGRPSAASAGTRYGRLVAVERFGKRGNDATWLCVCDCGNKAVVVATHLKSGKTSSCGCLKGDTRPMPGRRFGCWLVESRAGSQGGAILWQCVCDCGTRRTVTGVSLRSGETLSCGCLARQVASILATTHGHSRLGQRNATYRSWESMKRRCTNPTTAGFASYGGRGISICPRWLDFEAFLSDMGERPDGRSLDRINVNGNYEPGNCRWATPTEQARNKRSSVFRDRDVILLRALAQQSGNALELNDLADRIEAIIPVSRP